MHIPSQVGPHACMSPARWAHTHAYPQPRVALSTSASARFVTAVPNWRYSLAARFSKYASILRDPGSRNVEAVASNFGLGREKAQ
mgnify:CR=1 FL=1